MNRKQHQVWITLYLSGSDEKSISDDKLRVQDLYRCIQELPGRDHYDVLVANGEWLVRLTPDDNTMHYSKELHQKIESILAKQGSIEVKVMDM
jgi:DNA polymerase-3 subunit alpha